MKSRINYYLKKDKLNSQGDCAIFGKIEINKTKTTFFTGIYVSIERWENTGKFKRDSRNQVNAIIKNRLDNLKYREFPNAVNSLRENDHEITAINVKKLLKDEEISDSQNKTITDAFKWFLDNFKKKVESGRRAEGTLEKYERMAKHFIAFIEKIYHKRDVELKNITKEMIYDYEDYIENNLGCSHNTVVKYMRNMKTIINQVVKKKNGWIFSNPFNVYDESLKQVKAIYLEANELKAIEEKVFDIPRLQLVRDIFLFSCYTSYAPCDVARLTKENVYEKDGETWIYTRRKKTGIDSNIMLLPTPLAIIEKYKNDIRCINEKRILPKLSNQKMNAYLKEIADVCNIKKKLTYYVARHTFATTIAINNDLPIEIISTIMGHTNIRQTQHYAKILDKSVARGMRELKKRLE